MVLNVIFNRLGKFVLFKVLYLKVVVVDGYIFKFYNVIKYLILLLIKIIIVCIDELIFFVF